jgi:hypothetical protein
MFSYYTGLFLPRSVSPSFLYSVTLYSFLVEVDAQLKSRKS